VGVVVFGKDKAHLLVLARWQRRLSEVQEDPVDQSQQVNARSRILGHLRPAAVRAPSCVARIDPNSFHSHIDRVEAAGRGIREEEMDDTCSARAPGATDAPASATSAISGSRAAIATSGSTGSTNSSCPGTRIAAIATARTGCAIRATGSVRTTGVRIARLSSNDAACVRRRGSPAATARQAEQRRDKQECEKKIATDQRQ
jgi:hypothetical protein